MSETMKDAVDFVRKYKAWHASEVDEFGDPADYKSFDQGRIDYGEDALAMVERLVEDRPQGIDLVFGDGADKNTFDNVFGHMTGYTIAVNGVDIQVTRIYYTKGHSGHSAGLTGLRLDDDGEYTGGEVGFAWEEITSVEIY